MLLARLSGATKLNPADAAKSLDKNNGLLARTLELLGQTDARQELVTGFEMLQRSLEALNPHDFLKSRPDLWLYFYEDFLAAYDPKLRKDFGVYYTPREVVELQVRLAGELLEKRFSKKLSFADDGVVFLDPAVGTGTYPVAAVKHGLERVAQRSGKPAVPARAKQMAENLYGFEVLVGPYAVAHLRLTQALEGAINNSKAPGEDEEKLHKRLNIFLADTLESPNSAPPGGLDLTHRVLTQEHEAARKLKKSGDVLVCLGNPPYDRQIILEGDTITQRKGGWVRFGDQITGGAKQEEQGNRPILTDFLLPVSAAGYGTHAKMLYNDYVYFWRWALWRLFEQQKCGGIITFITASSYLAGPGFVGMREVMRQTFDELWVLDLGGDNLGARKTPNVFNIQTPVAIAIGVRASKSAPGTPARVYYARINGVTRDDKLAQLAAAEGFASISWLECPTKWRGPFLPSGSGTFFDWPHLEDVLPYSFPGVQAGRNWIIGETDDLLTSRLNRFLVNGRLASEFKESRDTKINSVKRDVDGNLLKPVANWTDVSDAQSPKAFGFRSFDLQRAFLDPRLCDWTRPDAMRMDSEKQVYFGTLYTEVTALGAALSATCGFPDLNFFHGRGGRIVPIYRDADGSEPNVTAGLLDALSKEYGSSPSPEDLIAYLYTVLGGQSYTRRFWNELRTPGPRVPLTKSGVIFAEAVSLGRKLIWLHTYAQRFRGEDRGEEVLQGAATTIRGIPSDEAAYPIEYSYDANKQEIAVGAGRFGPVAAEIWEFEISGLKVVQSWLSYRMKVRSGRKSSPLDDIRPERWTSRMSDNFLELLWVLEFTLAMEPDLEGVLDKIVVAPCFNAAELPTPKPEERKAPSSVNVSGALLALMGVVEGDD